MNTMKTKNDKKSVGENAVDNMLLSVVEILLDADRPDLAKALLCAKDNLYGISLKAWENGVVFILSPEAVRTRFMPRAEFERLYHDTPNCIHEGLVEACAATPDVICANIIHINTLF